MIKHAIFYEEKQPGLGLRFANGVNQAAEEISTLPTGYASYYKHTRERSIKNFPFKLIYTIELNMVYIHAIYPTRANPRKNPKVLNKAPCENLR